MAEKRGVIQDYLIWIGIAALVVLAGLIFVLFSTGKGREALEWIKNLFRFGG